MWLCGTNLSAKVTYVSFQEIVLKKIKKIYPGRRVVFERKKETFKSGYISNFVQKSDLKNYPFWG